MSDKRRCFVIGPIGKPGSEERRHADMLLNAVVKSVLESDDFPYEVIRSDHVADPGMINDKVIHDILNAELVVADLTFLNANAFYELGIRHAATKPAIHIAQAGTRLPFDTFGYRAIIEDLTDWHGKSGRASNCERRRGQQRHPTTRSATRSRRPMLVFRCGRAPVRETGYCPRSSSE
jgi:L-arabinose isomerase